MRILGIVASTMSLISAVQRLLNVGLISFLNDFVAYYRKLTYPLVEALPGLFHLALPNWYKDQFILSFVIVAAFMRSANWNTFIDKSGVKVDTRFQKLIFRTVQTSIVVFYAFIFSIALLGIPMLLISTLFVVRNWFDPTLFDRVNYDPWIEVELAEQNRFVISICVVIVATIVFFVLNAYS